MQSATHKELERALDANFNRAKEALRVCEDIFRFIEDDARLTRRIKNIRHALTESVTTAWLKKILSAREVDSDIGRGSTKLEMKRSNVNDVLWANLQRAKESLRVLEELLKLFDLKAAQRLKNFRYKVYALEKEIIIRR